MISALSLAISTAVSTLIPTSASLKATASLIPSPIKPTVCPLACKVLTTLAFCVGLSFAKIDTSAICACSSSSVICSTWAPIKIWSKGMPTSLQIFWVTISLSPVSTFTLIPSFCRAVIAVLADGLAGSRKPIKPVNTMLLSSSMV